VKESRADGVAAIVGRQADRRRMDRQSSFGRGTDLGRQALGLDATAPRRASRNGFGGVGRPGLWQGIDRLLTLPISTGLGGAFGTAARCQRFLPGCLRGSSTPAAGRWPGCGLLRPAHGSAGRAHRRHGMRTSALESLAMLPGSWTAQGRDQSWAQWSPVPQAGAGEGQSEGEKKGGHGGTQLEFCRSSNGRIRRNRARRPALQEPAGQWAPVKVP